MIYDLFIILGIGTLCAVAVARAQSELGKARAEILRLLNRDASQAARIGSSEAYAVLSQTAVTRAKNEALAWKGAAEQARRNAAEVETAYFSALVEIEKLKIENEKLKGKNPL